MKVAIRKWVKRIIYIFLGLGSLYVIFGFVLYIKLSTIPSGYAHPKNSPANFTLGAEDKAPATRAGDAVDPRRYTIGKYQTVSFPSLDKQITLSAWYIPARHRSSEAIIVIPGYKSSKSDPRQLMIARLLHQSDYNVLMLDVRNMGKSTVVTGRTAMGNEEFKDILGAKAWLVKKGITDIGLVGVSMGASTAAIAFAHDKEIKAALLDSPYTSVKEMIQQELARLRFPPFLWSSGYWVAKIFYRVDLLAHSPKDLLINHLGDRWLMLYHAKDDTRVSIAHSQKVDDALSKTAQNLHTWFYDSQAHAKQMILDTANYQKKMVTFFDKAFNRTQLIQ